jgi:hypothetical protein
VALHRCAVFLLALAIPLAFTRCSHEAAASQGDTLVRERTASFFANNKRALARQEIAPLVARKDAVLEDLVRAAAIEFADGQSEACGKLLDRAAKLDPKAPLVLYMRGMLAYEAGDSKAAEPILRAALEAAPGDLPTRVHLAQAEADLGRVDEAEKLLRSVIAVGVENGGNWYAVAVYRMARLLVENHREAEAEPFQKRWQELTKLGAKQSGDVVRLGSLVRAMAPRPERNEVAKPEPPGKFTARAMMLPELGGAHALIACDLDGDGHPDLVAYGPKGLAVALWREKGWEAKVVTTDAVDLACALDIDNDSTAGASLLSFVIVQKEKATLLHCERGKLEWKPSPLVLPALPSPPSDIVAVDYDHEGDLDLLLVGPFGARLWRNDGAAAPDKGGKFTDVTADAGLPTDHAFDWCVTEDFDGDNDVDLLLGGAQSLYLADNLRAGKFADKTAKVFPPGTRLAEKPIAADLDGDARADLWTASAIWHQRADNSFEKIAQRTAAAPLPNTLNALDVDLDGSLDLVWKTPASLATARLAVGLPQETEVALHSDDERDASGPMTIADFDGKKRLALAFSTPTGIRLFDAPASANHSKHIALRGLRDNRRGVGAVIEFRAGSVYRRIYFRGEPLLVGVGSAKKIDVLRVTWPNGIVQSDLDVDLEDQTGLDDPDAAFGRVTQASGLAGSCPFLYACDGERNVFVSDVLGITPLGLPMAPGEPGKPDEMVPFDHDEFVLVRGDQLKPKDGAYELTVTEELREVTYLDRAQLLVVDHPSGTEIQPNERFTFPPFPEAHTHTIRDPIAPLRATGSDGKDWTKALAAIDDVHAVPFELQPSQFAGLAKPWFLELEFDKARVASAKKLRLLMTGWFSWGDASANMSSARHPGMDFVPPMFQVPDGKGGWRDAGPPVGFPAGKTKTMVIDVDGVLARDDSRIRVFCTLRLYWDAIRLATDGDDAELDVKTLEPASARLWRRGFSAPLASTDAKEARGHRPERFDWNVLAAQPRWNQHPGMYTRYGECLPLLQAVDDMFVILGAGDALTLRFDARDVPAPKPGFVRDYLLFLDGWAKDRDPNTLAALEVEPLPFHAMTAYPYAAAEHFPDDDAHRAWRAQWNTRPAWEWIRPLSPQREIGWLIGD